MSSHHSKLAFTGEVQSVRRALSILEALSARRQGLTLKMLAEQVDLPPSTAHRLLTTLQNHHYVLFEPGHNLWRLGAQVMELASSLCAPSPPRQRDNGCGAA